ncbi:MAG: type II toxin-antitoxin system RelE/ParE family toxin [Actinomycetales bacterium]|nr:type II toxin-antitoxin system RelE/ParE family toxin [Actinomycetales bacterium]
MEKWIVDISLIESWLSGLDKQTQRHVVAAVIILEREGPQLGRPLVDTVKGSRHKNMKELRPSSSGRSEIRVLFAFDHQRRAILLVGGDKQNLWNKWYSRQIIRADALYDQYLREKKDMK